MPPSVLERAREPAEVPGHRLAVAAEALYLTNLMLLPGIAFLALLGLAWKHWKTAPALAYCHLAQTVSASVWAGVLLLVANAAIIAIGGYDAPATWVIVILYFTCCHTTLILFGVVGLARALAGKPFVYPLIGRRCDGQR